MAKLDKACLSKCSKNDIDIEKAVYRNIARIKDKETGEIHQNILDTLEVKSIDDSTYFSYENFEMLVLECREKKEKAVAAAQKREEEKKRKEEEKKEETEYVENL